MISYADQHHVYFNERREIYDSPTKIIKKYRQRFDAKTASKAYAKKFDHTPKYWQEQWKEKGTVAIKRGNTIHSSKEQASFGLGNERVGGKIRPVVNGILYQPQNLYELPDGSYPEFPIWNDGYKIAGRPDKFIIETVGQDRFIDIYDYKTNGKIDKVSFQDRNGSYKMMLPPVQHLMNAKWQEYAIQLSMYMYILEAAGFIPRSMQLIHIPHPIDVVGVPVQPADVLYPLPYLKDEVLNILNHHNKKRKVALYEPQ